MKVVSTDQKQTNNLTSLIIWFSKQRIYFYFLLSMLRPIHFFDLFFFYLTYIFYFINPRHPLHILVPDESLFFIIIIIIIIIFFLTV